MSCLTKRLQIAEPRPVDRSHHTEQLNIVAVVDYMHEPGTAFSLHYLGFNYINNPNHIIKIVIVSI